MSRYSKKGKFALLLISALIGVGTYVTSCSYSYSRMTPWQIEQKIDPEAGTGSTKFSAHVNAALFAGIAFCLTAIGGVVYVKTFSRK